MTSPEFWSRSVRSLTPRSFKLYRGILRKFDGVNLNRDVIQAHFDGLRTRLSPTTLRNHITVAGAYLRALGLPAKDWLPRLPRGEPDRYVATREDYDAMLGALDPSNPRNLRAIVCLRILWDTGCRVGELVAIPYKARYSGRCDVRTLKTNLWRTLFWSDETEAAIRAWLAVRGAAPGALLVAVNRWGRYGATLTTRQVQRLVDRLRDALKLDPKLTAHSFRHSRIHRWLDADLNPFEVRRLSGHRSADGLEHYTRYGSEHVARMARRAM